MKWALRKSVELDRMYKRRGLRSVKRIAKTNGHYREWLYAKMDRDLDKLRHGLKELGVDTMRMRRKPRTTVPNCPKYRWE
jgi:non-ribosomal peptide synthetase component E (peptide arylation enzyme)